MPTILGVRAVNDGSIELGSGKVITRYKLEYRVLADNASQGPITIRSTVGLPKVGISVYSYNGESDLTAVCKKKGATQSERQPRLWHVVCEFDNDPLSQSQEDEDNTPGATVRPPQESWGVEYGEEVMHRDFTEPTAKAIVNPVGLPFDPPLTRRVIYPVLTIQRWQTTFTPASILAYVDHQNENEFRGAGPGHALMVDMSANRVVEDAGLLWEVTYRIRFSEEGFRASLLNQSTHYRLTSGAATLTAFIADGVPYVANINADGTKATAASYSEFQRYPKADFDTLAL